MRRIFVCLGVMAALVGGAHADGTGLPGLFDGLHGSALKCEIKHTTPSLAKVVITNSFKNPLKKGQQIRYNLGDGDAGFRLEEKLLPGRSYSFSLNTKSFQCTANLAS